MAPDDEELHVEAGQAEDGPADDKAAAAERGGNAGADTAESAGLVGDGGDDDGGADAAGKEGAGGRPPHETGRGREVVEAEDRTNENQVAGAPDGSGCAAAEGPGGPEDEAGASSTEAGADGDDAEAKGELNGVEEEVEIGKVCRVTRVLSSTEEEKTPTRTSVRLSLCFFR